MPIQDPTRTRRRIIRLGLIAAVLLLFAGGFYALFLINSQRHELTPQEIVERAQEAAEEENYRLVLELLEDPASPAWTIDAIQDDADLLQAYVTARQNSPLTGNQHLRQLVNPLKKIVEIQPENLDARQTLLTLLITLGRDQETLTIAEELAQRFPEDAEIKRYLGSALLRIGEDERALEVYKEAVALEPLHVRTQAAMVRLLQDTEAETDTFMQQARQLHEAHPEDPRAELILSLARQVQGDRLGARELLLSAAERPAPDDAFIQTMVQILDNLDLYAVSYDYLQRVAGQDILTYPATEAIKRAFDLGDNDAALARLESADPKQTPTDLLGLWAIALHRQGDARKADHLVDELDRRDELPARAWVKFLPLLFAKQTTPGNLIDAFRKTLASASDREFATEINQHPYLMQILGEAYLSVGEAESALTPLTAAGDNNQTWARPQLMVAELLMGLDRPDQALVHAELAMILQPTETTLTLHTSALLASTNPNDRDAVDAAIARVDRVLDRVPNHGDVTKHAVELLIKAGRKSAAIQRIREVLEADQPASLGLLQSLADLSAQYRIGLDDTLNQALATRQPDTRQAVVTRAYQLADAGKQAQGRALLEAAMPETPSLVWEITRARYLTLTSDAQASANWAELADKFPNDLALQIEAIQSVDVQQHGAFAKRAIARLRDVAGESSINWRIEQARLIMQPSANNAQLKEALALLLEADRNTPNHLAVQLLLARCYAMLDNLPMAQNLARSAKALAPDNPQVMLVLGQALLQNGELNEAIVELTKLSMADHADPSLRLRASALLNVNGERRATIEALESMRAKGLANQEALLLLTRAYATTGQFAQADALCKQLLLKPDTESLSFVAAYFDQTARSALAEQAIASAQDASISQADRLLLGAQMSARRGQADKAIASMIAAAELEPSSPARWHDAVQMAFDLSRPQDAKALAERGLKALRKDAPLEAITRDPSLFEWVKRDPALTPLAIAILTQEQYRATAVKAIRIIKTDASQAESTAALAELTKEDPGFRVLHELASERLLQAGQNAKAFELASQAMDRFPLSAAVARVASLSAYNAEDWGALRRTAQAWAQRNPGDRAQADLLYAAALDGSRRYTAVLKTLSPYVTKMQAEPAGKQAYFDLYTRALVRTGKSNSALAFLKPHFAQHPDLRMIAISRIAADLPYVKLAQQWLTAVTAIPSDDPTEQLERVRSAFYAGMRLKDDSLLKTALALLESQHVEGSKPSIDVTYLHGMIAQELGDLTTAEANFRLALKYAPDNPGVMNNLAMLLSVRGKDLKEAEQLAMRATELSTEDPNHYDTLANVRLRQGNLDLAMKAIDRAVLLQPEYAAWRLTRANILEAQGNTEEAEAIRQRFSRQATN